MPALLLRPTPAREGDSALVLVLEAYIETLKAENEILRRRLAAAEARAARDTANAEHAIAEFSAITKRLRARAQRLAG
jgi:inorganic triphosphatase YgiF